jgi:hypothetical protein
LFFTPPAVKSIHVANGCMVLVGCIGTASAQPPNARIDKAVPLDVQLERLMIHAERKALFVIVRPTWTDEQIGRWVFWNGNASAARQELESQLAAQISDIDRACSLTDTERKKLQLAGRGDIKRFFDRIQQESNSPRISLGASLFHEDSLLVKSLRNTLTSDQFARCEAIARKRRELRHHESVLNAVAMLKLDFEEERAIVVREAQWQDLLTLMTHETAPSRRPGPCDYQVLLLQLGRLPEEKLKRLFDPDHRQIMQRVIAGYQRLEPMLRQEGLLPAEGDGE